MPTANAYTCKCCYLANAYDTKQLIGGCIPEGVSESVKAQTNGKKLKEYID